MGSAYHAYGLPAKAQRLSHCIRSLHHYVAQLSDHFLNLTAHHQAVVGCSQLLKVASTRRIILTIITMGVIAPGPSQWMHFM